MKEKIIKIKKAKYLSDFKIEFEFSDCKKKVVDFNSFLLSSKNPVTMKYQKESKFKKFKLDYGDIVWGDYEMCFPIWDLYSGRI